MRLGGFLLSSARNPSVVYTFEILFNNLFIIVIPNLVWNPLVR